MMRNNKLYKILRITFLLLAIVSMTFSIFYKVGHCEEPSSLGASSGGSSSGSTTYYPFASDIPLTVSSDVGFPIDVPQSLYETIADNVTNGRFSGYPYVIDCNLLIANEYNSSGNYLRLIAYNDGYIDYFVFPSLPFTSPRYQMCHFAGRTSSSGHKAIIIEASLTDGHITYVSSSSGDYSLYFNPIQDTTNLCWVSEVVPGLPVPIYQINKNQYIYSYPVWIRDGSLSYNGEVKFSQDVHSGGESDKQDAIDDIDDSIEDSSQLPQVDDELPADPTTPSLIKKILSALKTLNKTIGGVGISIVDTLKKILGKLDILDDIKQFYQDYNNIKNTSSSDVVTAFQGTIIYTTYSNIRSDISSFLNMFNVTPASSAPTWTIPLNGTVLYNQNYPNIVIDFGFYDRFRNTVSNILVAILTCSCVFNIIRSIPDIITGASGDESS